MSFDLSSLQIKMVIIHQILKQPLHAKEKPPIYSDTESRLDDELRLFLKDRITGAIESDHAYEIFYENPDTSFLTRLIARAAGDPNEFVAISRELADHLNRVQTGNSPGGLVTVIQAELAGKFSLAILKLEREEGARLHRINANGKTTFDLRHIRDLILTEKTKLFKIALFAVDANEDYGFDGKICDNQLARVSNRDVALFFLKTFLGCKLAGDPKVDTRDFFNAVQEFINTQIDDPLIQSRYNLHILSYLSQDRAQLNPRLFAADCLNESHRQPFIDHLRSKGITSTAIQRDVSLISKKLEKMIIDFENDVRIIASKENFEDAVSLEKLPDGRTRAEVVSKIKRIQS